MALVGLFLAVYNESMLRGLDVLRPSLLILQPPSRNDRMSQATPDLQLAKLLATNDKVKEEYRAATIYQSGYSVLCVDPSNGGSPEAFAAWQSIRSVLDTMAEAGIPVWDSAWVIGSAFAPWICDHRFSDDGTHPNDLTIEILTPIARQLIDSKLTAQ